LIFRIASKFLKPVAFIRAPKQINAAVMVKILNAGEDTPGFIDSFRHLLCASYMVRALARIDAVP